MQPNLAATATLEEAVALLINLDYVPAGFTVSDMTSAFLEEAEAELANAAGERRGRDDRERLAARVEICRRRHELGLALLDGLAKEVAADSSLLAEADHPRNPLSRVSLAEVNRWASDRFGVCIPEFAWHATDSVGPAFAWADVEIKIYRDYRIGWRARDGKWTASSFREIDLMGSRKTVPNALGALLIGLAQGKKFPSGKHPAAKDKTAISKLRDCLCRLTGLKEDPFLSINEADGWRPRFAIGDERRNADERAKGRAVHVPLDAEPPDFKREEDDAQDWLDHQK